ncbi:MAG: glycosyltransferase family 61 protein [Pseudomonadota bacterium]
MTDLKRSLLKRLCKANLQDSEPRFAERVLARALSVDVCWVEPAAPHAAAQINSVRRSTDSVVAQPKALGSNQKLHAKVTPAQNGMIFKNVSIWPDSSFLKRGRAVFAPTHASVPMDDVLWRNSASCVWDLPGVAAVSMPRAKRIEKGICLFGHGAANWYHWLIEILPMGLRATTLEKEFAQYPLLVPQHALDIASFRDGLEVFREGREIVALHEGARYDIGDLVVLPQSASGPVNLVPGRWPKPEHYSQDVGHMRQFRKRLLERLLDNGAAQDLPKRVFLMRRTDRRNYNQTEVLEAAETFGFVPVRPETLSLSRQIALFHNAECVVGMTGAAWAGALFMQPGAKALVWMPEEFTGGCFFSNLAHISGADMSYRFTRSQPPATSTEQIHFQDTVIPKQGVTRDLEAILADTASQSEPKAASV